MMGEQARVARGPCVVSTVEELDALPNGTAVHDGTGWRVSQKYNDGLWYRTNEVAMQGHGRTAVTLLRYGPVTVVFTPTTESED